ncbi:MAG: nicotinate-nucleotide--dimethylbenzimidazole phosphoribosyltransferase [Opitutales bacterium]|nr:nicotinate-nucleotide--dimethylbenzimidazole phosphoribosyltransferase [Opitutales bacterium]
MLEEAVQKKIDTKTKPQGALGKLETLARQVALIQGTTSPVLRKPTILVFAGDHGIAAEGVSAYPQEVTAQMVKNFLAGGAAINVFCAQNGIALKVIDAGVREDLPSHPSLVSAKVDYGTKNFRSVPAMTKGQMEEALSKGREALRQVSGEGCTVVGFGEMGIGNTSSASLLMSLVGRFPLEQCVGRGTGLTESQLLVKKKILAECVAFHGPMESPEQILQTFGGFEIAQMCGAMEEAAEHGMVLMVDGFIASCAFLVAVSREPRIRRQAIFCHASAEAGHRHLLEFLGADPLLSLDLRLGEGSGCALAYPLIRNAVGFLNDMASFASAGVSSHEE